MEKNKVVSTTEKYVKSLIGNGSGHGWWHAFRVRNIALEICKKEGGDAFIIEIASLLHDISDWKFNGGDHLEGSKKARAFLKNMNVDEKTIEQVCEIIDSVTFRGAGVKTPMNTKEGKIVQDADRLDAMGAIGVARAFAYGGQVGREIYNPEKKSELHGTFDKYKNSNSPSINHFYEKLLLLKDRMNTSTGKEIAADRHAFMEKFLDRFFSEWDGKK